MPRRFKMIIPPGEVEAMQLTPENIQKAETWSGGIQVVQGDPFDGTLKFTAINIPTEREGVAKLLKRFDGKTRLHDAADFVTIIALSSG
jgi:hypothetical protein